MDFLWHLTQTSPCTFDLTEPPTNVLAFGPGLRRGLMHSQPIKDGIRFAPPPSRDATAAELIQLTDAVFTCDGVLYDFASKTLVDPSSKGLHDIYYGIIRPIDEASLARCTAEPCRVLDAVHLAACENYSFTREIWEHFAKALATAKVPQASAFKRGLWPALKPCFRPAHAALAVRILLRIGAVPTIFAMTEGDWFRGSIGNVDRVLAFLKKQVAWNCSCAPQDNDDMTTLILASVLAPLRTGHVLHVLQNRLCVESDVAVQVMFLVAHMSCDDCEALRLVCTNELAAEPSLRWKQLTALDFKGHSFVALQERTIEVAEIGGVSRRRLD